MRPVVVGIAGGTASGKSTLARKLCEVLGDRSLLLLHDRYYFSLPEHLRGNPLEYNFDHPESLETERLVRDLATLRTGKPAMLPRYDFAHHLRCEEEDRVEPHPVIVLEGILVLADPGLRAVMDHRVYVTAPDDIRLARRIRRDLDHRGREVHEVLAQYERTVRPMHLAYVEPSRAHADLVIDGTVSVEQSVRRVLDLIGA
jgi:uridine kinase